jgi:chromosome partitioning protein
VVSHYPLARVCRSAAQRGQQLQESLQQAMTKRHQVRELPTFGIERAAKLIGCSTNYLRRLEEEEVIPQAKTITAGSVQRRLYTYNTVNEIKKKIERLPEGAKGARTAHVVFANLKGGVGKTTMALHFAQYLAREGYEVLLVDADPQATITGAFGFIPELDLGTGDDLFDAMVENPLAIKDAVKLTHWANLALVPGRLALQFVDWNLSQKEARDRVDLGPPIGRLQRALQTVREQYDVIVIDTPPALGMLSINAIAASDLLIMPIVPHMYDISSSIHFFKLLTQLSELHSEEINVQRLAILLTKVDQSTETYNNIELIRRTYGDLLLSNRMGLTRELQKTASDMVTIYETEQPRGSRETYNRAVVMLDAVNEEILLAVRQLWHQQRIANEQGGNHDA